MEEQKLDRYGLTSEYGFLYVLFRKSTEKAILVSPPNDQDHTGWLPKSQIIMWDEEHKQEIDVQWEELEPFRHIGVAVKSWLLDSKEEMGKFLDYMDNEHHLPEDDPFDYENDDATR